MDQERYQAAHASAKEGVMERPSVGTHVCAVTAVHAREAPGAGRARHTRDTIYTRETGQTHFTLVMQNHRSVEIRRILQ